MMMMMTTMGLQKPSSPSIFRGRGVYQLHLVKADAIRPYIPSQLRIVETFGYTMGGFMLSSYEDSPFGPFQELVILAGIVSHRGSSFAWTGKAVVSTEEVCQHSREVFGIPTEVAKFSKHKRKTGGFLNMRDIQITETNSPSNNITIRTPAEAEAAERINISRFIISPPIKLSLTSLSGLTEYDTRLLEYTCNFETRLRVVSTSKVCYQIQVGSDNAELGSSSEVEVKSNNASRANMMRNQMIDIVMKSHPILAFEFDSMTMVVDSPTVLSPP